jgi:signal peptidase I
MEPQLARDDYVLVEQTNRGIRRGDILVTKKDGDHRVVGLPGETVWVDHGQVRICGPGPAGCRRLAEPYVHYPDTSATFGPIAAKTGWVIMADDRYLFPRLATVVSPSDVVGVIRGSVLSYGELYPSRPHGWPEIPTRPEGPTLVYQP